MSIFSSKHQRQCKLAKAHARELQDHHESADMAETLEASVFTSLERELSLPVFADDTGFGAYTAPPQALAAE